MTEAEAERARIVAWLREYQARCENRLAQPPMTMVDGEPSQLGDAMYEHTAKAAHFSRTFADAIEALSHHKEPEA